MNSTSNIVLPTPRSDLSIGFSCNYESEIDRQLILHTMGHYIEYILGSKDILFVTIPMSAVNQEFVVDESAPGEEINFVIDYKKNCVTRKSTLNGDELPPLWSVMLHKETGFQMITTIEPCKFIILASELNILTKILNETTIAPYEYNVEALEKVYWNEETEKLKRDFEFFTQSKQWFSSRGLSFNRSYLLHGPPGNGKTTTIKAFSKYLDTKPEIFDFSAQYKSPDKAFTSWVLGTSDDVYDDEYDGPNPEENYEKDSAEIEDNSPTPIRLLILEDLDRFYPSGREQQTSVSLSCILNALDGSIERKNTIIIATANHPEDLDQQVLLRPGRFDRQILYKHPDQEHSFLYLKKLFKDENVSDKVLEKVSKAFGGHSYAFHKEILATSASYAFMRETDLINDQDIENALNDLISSVSHLMKSEVRKAGF